MKDSALTEALERCQELIGYRFRDVNLLRQGLTHASVASTRAQSNERLEFVGDAVLALSVCSELYAHEKELLEGRMTKIKSTVVSRQTCAQIAEAIGICDVLALGKGMASEDGLPLSVSAAVFESIIGAIYVDGGFAPANEFVMTHVRPYIERALGDEHHQNYKSVLQQHAQRKWGAQPIYEMLDEKGPDHSKCFEVAVSVNGRIYPSAWGTTKKEAEQQAAKQVALALGLIEAEEKDAEIGPS